MKKLLLVVVLIGSMTNFVFAGDLSQKVVDHLQTVAVTVKCERKGSGSGIVKTRQRGKEYVSFVWTAAHVVEGLRKTREIVDGKTGSKKTIIEFEDPKVIQVLVEDGRTLGKLEVDARVIRYNSEEDFALLRVRRKNFMIDSVKFYLKDEIPHIGNGLIHVGSLLGIEGSNSLTTGIISQIGRLDEGKVFDQTTCTAFPGSSGGGVYLQSDGSLVGMILRGRSETFNFMAPVRRIAKWAKSAKVEWAIDDNIPLPSDKELDEMIVEDNGSVVLPYPFNHGSKQSNNLFFKFEEKDNGKNDLLLRLLQSIL
jgi:hypothetical protein